MKQPLKNICGLLILFVLIGCKESETERLTRIVTEWQGKEIIFPEGVTFKNYLNDSIYSISDFEDKILVYIDSLGCTSCKIQFDEWINFVNITDSISGIDNLCFFIVDTRNPQEFLRKMKMKNFYYPVFIDKESVLNTNNNFPNLELFQTFLIDSLNEVKIIGNPLKKNSIKNLYIEYLINKRKIKG